MNVSFTRMLLLCFTLLCVGLVHAQSEDFICISQDVMRSDELMKQYLREEGVEIMPHNSVRLLPSGEIKFTDLLQAIRDAKHHVHVEYYIFNNDSIGNEMINLLRQKAKEGVEVRVLYDGFGAMANKSFPRKERKQLKREGVEMVAYDPIRFPYLHHSLHRDHRKIVVIDGWLGYTGGMNVGDEYIHGIPKIGPWRDMHLRVEGDAVNELQCLFLDLWNKTTRQKIGGIDYFPQAMDPSNQTEMAIVDRWPDKRPKLMRNTIRYAIHTAAHEIKIVNPYFVPTRGIGRELRDAIKRGVDVQIMVSLKADIKLTPDAVHYTCYQLSKRGAKVYLFDDGFHHSKVMMIDSCYNTVGSTNLDSRSLRYDYEVNAFIFDQPVTDELIALFEADKENSILLTREVWRNKSVWKRFVAWFAHLFTPVI